MHCILTPNCILTPKETDNYVFYLPTKRNYVFYLPTKRNIYIYKLTLLRCSNIIQRFLNIPFKSIGQNAIHKIYKTISSGQQVNLPRRSGFCLILAISMKDAVTIATHKNPSNPGLIYSSKSPCSKFHISNSHT